MRTNEKCKVLGQRFAQRRGPGPCLRRLRRACIAQRGSAHTSAQRSECGAWERRPNLFQLSKNAAEHLPGPVRSAFAAGPHRRAFRLQSKRAPKKLRLACSVPTFQSSTLGRFVYSAYGSSSRRKNRLATNNQSLSSSSEQQILRLRVRPTRNTTPTSATAALVGDPGRSGSERQAEAALRMTHHREVRVRRS